MSPDLPASSDSISPPGSQAPGSAPGETPHLERRFGLWQATALNMSNMIGVGPFITIPTLMSTINGGGPQCMLGWIVALLIALPDGLVWAELGAAMPKSGGSYVFLREAFGRETWGRLLGFLFIWQFMISGPMEIGSGFIGMKQYLSFLLTKFSPGALQAVVVGVGVVLLVLLYRRIGSIAKITMSLWIGTMLTVLAVIFSGIGRFDPKIAFDFPPGAFSFSLGFVMGLGAAARIGVYDYLGYYDVCYIGEEVRDPARVIPRSIILSLLGVAAIYLLMNLAIIGTIPWRSFFVRPGEASPPIASIFMERIWGKSVASVFTGMILWTAIASVFALALGYSRVPYAAARDGCFFSAFSRLHRTRHIPHLSLILMVGLSVLFSFVDLSFLIEAMVTIRIVIQFIGQIGAVILLRKFKPESLPFRMWLYPLPALVAFAGWVFLFCTAGPKLLIAGSALLAVGAVCFFAWSRLGRSWPFAGGGNL